MRHEHDFYLVTGNCLTCQIHWKDEITRLRADVEDRERAIEDVERERNAALAQVAVLLETIRGLGVHVAREHEILTKARALLTRLERAERVNRALCAVLEKSVERYHTFNVTHTSLAWKDCGRGLCGQALTAWQEAWDGY